MTTESKPIGNTDRTKIFNRVLYTAFVLVAIYLLAIQHQVAEAMSSLGLALIFDPFVPLAWEQRPRYQKIWLLVHVTAVFALLGWMVFG